MTQPFKPHNYVAYQSLIGNHRSLEILGNLIIKFCQLNSFKPQDYKREAWHVVSCMNHQVCLFLKAGQSKTEMVKSFKTTPLVWHFGASFGLTHFYANFIMWNVILMPKTSPNLAKLLDLVQLYTS